MIPRRPRRSCAAARTLRTASTESCDLEQAISDNTELIEMGEMEGDAGIVADAEKAIAALKDEGAKVELDTLLSGEADANDSYLQINAGAGGTESQDWASMLMRMYVRWANQNKYKVEVLDEHAGEEAGIKSCTLLIKGHNAYGKLKTESGVHRLVRISPYDSNARRHTSFSSAWAYPVIDDNIDIEIVDSDLKVDTYRASGAAASTSTPPIRPCASPTFPPASSWPARRNAPSTRTAPPRSRC
jgi:peptide chain release factor 2